MKKKKVLYRKPKNEKNENSKPQIDKRTSTHNGQSKAVNGKASNKTYITVCLFFPKRRLHF